MWDFIPSTEAVQYRSLDPELLDLSRRMDATRGTL